MKVISGSLKGRNISGYDILGTRPTMDRVKESVFGMIQTHLDNSVVLDLFSGSGNYGIETISNGAKLVYFNDYNKKCVKVIKDNLENFGIVEKALVNNFDYQQALKYYRDNSIKFDLVFLDPPYSENYIEKILVFLNDNSLLNDNALVICELTNNNLFNEYGNLIKFKERTYGEKQVLIFKNKNS